MKVTQVQQIDCRLSDASLTALSLNIKAVMNRLADLENIANSYRINMAACREANDRLTKENAKLRAEIKQMCRERYGSDAP